MFRPHPRATALAAVAALALPLALAAAPPPKPGPPVALVVATDEYAPAAKLPKLKHAVASGIELANRLAAIGYTVRFVTGTESVEAAKKELTPGVAVSEANTGKAVTAAVQTWLTDAAKAPPPLAVLSLSGHGEERAKVPHLLARDDPPGEGGLSVQAVQDEAAKRPGVPLVVVFDACRTAAPAPKLKVEDPKGRPVDLVRPADPPAPEWSAGLGLPNPAERHLEFRQASADPKAPAHPATVLYSTHSGEGARDLKEDLVRNLADALRLDEPVRKVLDAADPGWEKRAAGLTLYHWIVYGVFGQLKAAQLTQSYQVVKGDVPLTAAVAKLVGGKPGKPDPAPRERDLLAGYAPQFGQFESAFDPALGWRLTRPALAGQELFAVGPVGGTAGCEADDRVLVIDLVAAPPPKPRWQQMAFEVHPKNHDADDRKGTFDTYLYPKNAPHLVAFGSLHRLTVPLKTARGGDGQPLRLNQLAFVAPDKVPEAWPVGASVTVVGLTARTREKGDPAAGASSAPTRWEPDLLTGWVASDPGAGGQALEMTRQAAKDEFVWSFKGPGNKPPGRMGGPLVRPVPLPAGHELVLTVRNEGDKEAEVTMAVSGEADGKGDPFSNQTVTLKAKPKEKAAQATEVKLEIKKPGYANYLLVTSTGDAVRVKSLKVRPIK